MAGFCTLTTRIVILITFISILAHLTPRQPSSHLSAANLSPQCLQPPPDSCSFYADCLETRYHCGPTGYPLDYGQKYCTAFQAARATLSAPAGQAWMLATMHCLQTALVDDAVGRPGAARTCAALADKAFATHADCYIRNGVCKLPPSDWEAILNIIDIKTLFDSWDALKATLTAGTECLEMYVFFGKKTLKQW
ncbi:hypothetical protein C8F01DRAFT_1045497 [Mycena amicta]|nr:hypothetical protein C8F01DRAFT_1045497 [Mycena amicta]